MSKADFHETAAGTTSGATASEARTGKTLQALVVSGHTDAESEVHVLNGADTVLGAVKVAAGGFEFYSGAISLDGTLKAKIVTSSAACQVNLYGQVRGRG